MSGNHKNIGQVTTIWPNSTITDEEKELEKEILSDELRQQKIRDKYVKKSCRVPALDNIRAKVNDVFLIEGRDSLHITLSDGRQCMVLPEDIILIGDNGLPESISGLPSISPDETGEVLTLADKTELIYQDLVKLAAEVDSTIHLDTYMSGPAVALRAAIGLLGDAVQGLTMIANSNAVTDIAMQETEIKNNDTAEEETNA